MIVIICAKYKKNWSRTVEATKQTRFSKSRPNDLEDIGQGQRSSHATHPLMLLIICTKYGKNPSWTENFEFWNGHYTRHTFWSCLIRCANMKWIRWVLLKIQSGHDSVHRRTDGQTDKVIPVYPPFNFVEAGGITIGHLFYATSSFVYHFVPIGEFKLELQSGNAQFGSNWTIFRAVRPCDLTDDLAKQ